MQSVYTTSTVTPHHPTHPPVRPPTHPPTHPSTRTLSLSHTVYIYTEAAQGCNLTTVELQEIVASLLPAHVVRASIIDPGGPKSDDHPRKYNTLNGAQLMGGLAAGGWKRNPLHFLQFTWLQVTTLVQCFAVCCNVLQCAVVSCSVLLFVAVC